MPPVEFVTAGWGRLRKGTAVVSHLEGNPLAVLMLLATLAIVIYSHTFSSPFVLDDGAKIVQNNDIKDLSRGWDFSGSRSIGFLSFAINYRIGRLNVVGYHLTNLLIHITNGFLVYTLVSLISRTSGSWWPNLSDKFPGLSGTGPHHGHRVALLTAMLFVAHPIQTGAVTYTVQRFTSLVTLFYLLSIVCYVQWRSTGSATRSRYLWYAGALSATMLAMKTKEISFTLPFMLVLVEGLCFRRTTRKQWWPLVPFLLMLPIIPLSLTGSVAEGSIAGFARETTEISRHSYLFTQFRVIVTYLRLLILPIHQNLDYDYPIYDSVLALPVVLSFLLLLTLLGAALYLLCYHPQWRLVGLGVLWFFLTLSVESSLIPIRDVIFEHRVYLPSVGIFLAGSALVVSRSTHRHVAPAIAVAMVVLCSIATYQRNLVWKDKITLWSNVASESPKKVRVHTALGNMYAQQGQVEQAIQEYLTVFRLNPDFPEAHASLGNVYLQQGRPDAAVKELMTALQLKPDFPEAHTNLGNAYLQQGRSDAAVKELMTALQLKPDFPEGHNNLGYAYAQQGLMKQATQEYLTAIQLNPDYPVFHHNLGDAYARQGYVDQAIKEYQTAIRLDPNYAAAHNNLGSTYFQQGQQEEGIKELMMALRLNPNVPEAHNNLGYAYTQQGRVEEAIKEFFSALQLKSDFPEAHDNLGSAFARQGRVDEAIKELLISIRLNPDLPQAHYHLGNAYQLKGLNDEARKQFETVLQLRPDFTPARQALKSLDAR